MHQKTTHIEAEELIGHIGQTVSVHGSVYKIRRMSGFSFLILRTKRQLLQCIHDPQRANFSIEDIAENMPVILTGEALADERSRLGVELLAGEIKILSRPAEPSPVVLSKSNLNVSLDVLLDYRPLSLRNEKERAIFKIQEGLCRGFRDYLLRNRFTEIRTPKIVSGSAEGGANVFPLRYFGREAFLAQSPQFYKQMMTGVFERVFEIGPVFRAERHNTSRHLNEYTSVDFEMGFIQGFEDIMREETKMIDYTLALLREEYAAELALWEVTLPEVGDIPAIRFTEAKKMLAAEYGRKSRDSGDFEPEEEKLLCELLRKQTGCDFVFVTHYKASKRPFYTMEDKATPGYTLSFDLLFRGLEVTTGGQRIHDYREQLSKMEALHMPAESFESYLMAHRYGLPPHGGLGLGLERFTARLLELPNVRCAALFPRDMNRLEP